MAAFRHTSDSERPTVLAGQAALTHRLLDASILVLAPHMDDETLACGGTLLLHQDRTRVHCLFATDGAASPAPLLPWQGRTDDGLAAARKNEAMTAMSELGIPYSNLVFLDLPDGRLSRMQRELTGALEFSIERIRPEFILAPFRYDVHPDHVALNRATRAVLAALDPAPRLLEYFVYHRLRLVPGGDIRKSLPADALLTIDTAAVAAAKRGALECYRSQTTLRYPWQDRPILTAESLAARCAEPETFLASDVSEPLAAAFVTGHGRAYLAYLLTRFGKRPKDRALAFWQWISGARAH